MLQREPDIVQPIQQTVAHEFIDRKLRAKALIVAHLALLQVDRELVVVDSLARCISSPDFISLRRTVRKPFFVLLLAKMSANEEEITARNPKSASAHTACSRDEPQPKFFPATRMLAPA
jgi:hypothetical protein